MMLSDSTRPWVTQTARFGPKDPGPRSRMDPIPAPETSSKDHAQARPFFLLDSMLEPCAMSWHSDSHSLKLNLRTQIWKQNCRR